MSVERRILITSLVSFVCLAFIAAGDDRQAAPPAKPAVPMAHAAASGPAPGHPVSGQ